MNRRTPRLLTALATVALAAGVHAAILAPDDLNLGLRGPGEVVETTVWLINTEDEPLEVLRAKGNCGCTTLVGFVPQTLPARSALEVTLRVTAAKKAGQDKAVAVTFTVKDRPPIRLPIRIETTGSPPAGGAVTAAPLDLGRVTAARRTESTVRLTNTATEPARVTGAKAGCGCITFPDFAPFELDPGASADVRLSIKAPSVTGRPRTRDVTFVVADHAPVKVPVRLPRRARRPDGGTATSGSRRTPSAPSSGPATTRPGRSSSAALTRADRSAASAWSPSRWRP
ncbi:MAG: DUF1573 domain-containing protein [Planctomycetota bacterium]|jgi:hypothetical protein